MLLHNIPPLLNKSGKMCTTHYRCYSLQSTELAFLNTWPISKVFYMKLVDLGVLHIPYNVPLFCIMSSFGENQ